MSIHIPRPDNGGYQEVWIPGTGYISVPGNWYTQEVEIYANTIVENPELIGDQRFASMYDFALFERSPTVDLAQVNAVVVELRAYVAEEYGLDLGDIIDWDDYKDWYNLQ